MPLDAFVPPRAAFRFCRHSAAPAAALMIPLLIWSQPAWSQTSTVPHENGSKTGNAKTAAVEKAAAPALEDFRHTVVLFDLAYNVTDREPLGGPDTARLAQFPFAGAWPNMLARPARKASAFAFANAATGSGYDPTKPGGFVFTNGALQAGIAPEEEQTLLFLRGVAPPGAVVGGGNVYVKGDMAGLINGLGYVTLVVRGDVTGSVYFNSYANAVIWGTCRGKLETRSSSKIYIMGGLGSGAALVLRDSAKLFLGGKTPQSALNAVKGDGTVYLQASDLAPGEYKRGGVSVVVLPSPDKAAPAAADVPSLPSVSTQSGGGNKAAPPDAAVTPLLPANLRPVQTPDDIADVPTEDLHVGSDINKRYLLMGPTRPAGPSISEGQNPKTPPPPPAGGYRLLLILPGGDGSPDFHPFIARMVKNALPPGYLAAQLCAVPWTPAQAKNLVWPVKQNTVPEAKFTTEEYMEAVVADVKAHHVVNAAQVFALGWSSSGPPVYSAVLKKDSPFAGGFVAMSVFQPGNLPALSGAKNKAFYLFHSPQDFIKIAQAETARDVLAQNGAKTTLTPYKGGHGWTEDVWGNIQKGMVWLDNAAVTKP